MAIPRFDMEQFATEIGNRKIAWKFPPEEWMQQRLATVFILPRYRATIISFAECYAKLMESRLGFCGQEVKDIWERALKDTLELFRQRSNPSILENVSSEATRLLADCWKHGKELQKAVAASTEMKRW